MSAQTITTGQDATRIWGQISAGTADELADAMKAWRLQWAGYAATIYRDADIPTLAHWRREKGTP